MLKGIWVHYDKIDKIKDCKYTIVYIEDLTSDENTAIYAENVIEWVKKLIYKLENEYRYKIYSISEQKEVSFEALIDRDFLFYSIKEAMEYQEFLITADDIDIKNYKDMHELLMDDNVKGIVITNDYDGGGLYFFINDDFLEYNWILEHLKPYNPDIFDYNIQNEDDNTPSLIRKFFILLSKIIKTIIVKISKK